MAILTAKNAGSGHENRGLLRQSDVSAVNRFTTFIVARSVDDCRFRLIVIDLLGRRIIVFDRWRRRQRWLDQRLQEEQEEQKEQEGTSRRSRRGRAEWAGWSEDYKEIIDDYSLHSFMRVTTNKRTALRKRIIAFTLVFLCSIFLSNGLSHLLLYLDKASLTISIMTDSFVRWNYIYLTLCFS